MSAIPIIIAPSILSADFAQLGSDSFQLLEHGADWLHLDVMDGHFVPNLTFGPPVIKALRQYLNFKGKENAILDCHLMVSEPTIWVPQCIEAGASRVTWHVECDLNHLELLQNWRQKYPNIYFGLALKPGTLLSPLLLSLLSHFDLILIMTVEPGFGGQKFMASCLEKVKQLRELFPNVHIEVDGGVAPGETGLSSIRAGANVLVSGTGVLGAKDWKQAISLLRRVS